MRTHERRSSIPITLLSLFLVFILWMAVAPTQLGGQVTYVIVDGNSMETKFHRGDLVLVRQQTAYQIGDAVTYRNAELGRLVFHRIVAADQDHFTIKGDNNSWLDSYQPTQAEIIGKLWIHIPSLGKAIEWVRLPIHLMLATGLLGGIFMTGMLLKPPQHNKRNDQPLGNFGGMLDVILYVAGFFTLAFLALSIFAFTRPLTRSGAKIQYQQEGFFHYSATGTPGIYDSATVQPGEPVFPKLTCFLNVGFTYNILGNSLQNISGSHQLSARVLETQSGWQRTIPLEAAIGFSGNSYFSMSTLDLCQLELMVDSMEKQTGLHASFYTLEIIPSVNVTGNTMGQTINDSFAPVLPFQFDKVHFYLATNSAQEDPLHVSNAGFAVNSLLEPNTLKLLGTEVNVQTLRTIALLGLLFSLSGLLCLAWIVFSAIQQDQSAFIRLKYSGMLMDVHEHMLEPNARIIEVTSVDDLAKLAERQNTLILHMTFNLIHYYMVQCNGTTYRHVVNTNKKGVPRIEPITRLLLGQVVSMEREEILKTELIDESIFGNRVPFIKDHTLKPQPVDEQFLKKIKI